MIIPQNTKNIIFDLGGVILNVDVNKTFNTFFNLVEKPLNIENRRNEIFSLCNKFEMDLLSEFEFREKICKILNITIDDDYFDKIWNSMILDYPPARIQLLKNLTSKYNIALLSNTNRIHHKHFVNLFKTRFDFDFSSLFMYEFYSHDLKLRKPDEKIFYAVLEKSNFKAEDTFFIDDNFDNVETAKKCGLSAYQIKESESIENLIKID